MKTRLLATTAAGAVLSLFAGQAAQAAVSCPGLTETVGSGGSVPASFLLNGTASSGNCVAAGDKIFGQFSIGGAITGTGSASFTFLMNPGSVTLGFAGVVAPSLVGSLDYTAAVNPAFAQGFLINNLEKDFTLNASGTGLPASATLTGTTTADPAFHFDCVRNVNPSTSTCPQTDVFSPVAQMTVDQTITTGVNAIVTGLTDTISQVAPSGVPEPGSLAILGAALAGLGITLRRRNKQRHGGLSAA